MEDELYVLEVLLRGSASALKCIASMVANLGLGMPPQRAWDH